MDEYDEEIYAIEEGRRSVQRPDDYEHYPIRLYEQEQEDMNMFHQLFRHSDVALADKLYSPDWVRVRRFFHTVKGFHTGDLDLTGRFESRYTNLISRWNVFSSQLNEIRQQDAQRKLTRAEDTVKAVIDPSDGRPVHTVDLELLESFCSQWKLRSSTIVDDLRLFYNEHDDVIACLKRNPEPKFQRLRFLDLPVELVHRVMSYLDEKGCRILRVCCRMLREASVLYAYEDLTFELAVETPRIFGPRQSDSDSDETDPTLREEAVGRLVERMVAICDVPTACQRMRQLRFCNHLDIEDLYRAHVQLESWLIPVTDTIDRLLSCARDIRFLAITHIPIQRHSLMSILTLPHLHTLELECAINIDAPIDICCTSVLNMMFAVKESNDPVTYILPSLPSLRCLTVSGEDEIWWVPDSGELRRKANIFTTLERLVLYDLHTFDLTDLTDWIREALPPNGSGLRLTQFKIEQRIRLLNGEEIRAIISALHGAPMQDLVLDGLSYAAPDLLDRISDAFPDLRSLTLCYRDKPQRDGRDAYWPHATWEYAPRLVNFRRLQHFRWNWRLLDEFHVPSPAAMLLFENNFPKQWEAEYALGSFANEWESIPRLFRAHCPTLESFAFLTGKSETVPYYCWDTTDEGLKEYSTDLDPSSHLLTDFNPECEEGWPRFEP